ncbi:MAG TPA: glycoside hydrolase family 3 C-terminal domain-containing protein [Streptosporangiaceae bacterium]|nr:glycoside hydrolase family 3 C-terminal domain-containing protein [Streptosporangiaceae bacterium]
MTPTQPASRLAGSRRGRVVISAVIAAAALAAGLPLALSAAGAPTAVASGRPAKPARPRPAKALVSCPWLKQSLPIGKRVAMVRNAMTLADKITMVEGQGTSKPYVFYMAAQPKLCIPAMGLEDGPNGVGDGLTGVTQLPAGVALAATFDPSLARQYGQVIGSEEWGKGAAVNLGPTVNIDRDPRWGRSFETFTEDPYLNAALAVSEIEGVQGTGELSQVKHFAVYNQETNRNTPADDAIISTRALHEIYLPAFEQAVTKAKVASVMCAYSTINGHYACQNPYLEKTTLDQRWGFPGFVTSDYGAIHATSAALDGTDMEQPLSRYFGQPLKKDVQDGAISVSVLNGMVSRILFEMFRFRLFNHPPTGNPKAVVTTPAHQAVSTKVAEAGTVLLKNSGPVLPLSPRNGGSIAVIGPAASAAPTDAGGGCAYVTAPFSVTPLAGLQAAAGPGTTVSYTQGLPADTSLPAIPSADLTPAYAPTGFGGSYSGTLTAPQTGTYVLALGNDCGCYTPTYLSLNGKQLLDVPGTPPVHTYSVAVHLVAGQQYAIGITAESSALTWGTPSSLAPDLSQAAAAARSAGTAVVVVCDDTETEAADRLSLSLPSAQDELIARVAAANPRTVVVIDAGAPVAMPWLGQVASVVDAWYPGESNGTALASVLFGATDPSGHLPVTFPVGLAQVPASTKAQFPGENGKVLYSEGIDVGYRWYDAKHLTPLFPFGYGLSYTRFAFSDLTVSRTEVTARVANVGQVAGSDVAQLYLGDPPKASEPPRQLKGFRRVTLAPGQSAIVRFPLTSHDLSYWSDAANRWVLPSGKFWVYVGDSSALANLPLRGILTIAGSR